MTTNSNLDSTDHGTTVETAPAPGHGAVATTAVDAPASQRSARLRPSIDRGTDPGPRDGRGLLHRNLLRLLSLVIILAIWWLVAELEIWKPVFVPHPADVWGRFIESISTEDGQRGLSGHFLWEHVQASLWRVLQGLFWAIVVGVPLGIALATVKPFQIIVEPAVNFIRSVPPLAYFSLLIIWFGIEDASKVWLLFLAAVAPIALAVLSGVRGVSIERIQAARSLGAGPFQVIRHTIVPSILPETFTGIRLAIGFAMTTIVAAETVDGIPGIGGLAWSTKKFQQTDIAILCIIVIGLTAIALDLLVQVVERRVVPWRGKG